MLSYLGFGLYKCLWYPLSDLLGERCGDLGVWASSNMQSNSLSPEGHEHDSIIFHEEHPWHDFPFFLEYVATNSNIMDYVK